MLQSRTFINRVLRNTTFSRRILSVVVDEAHCISHWGADFRKKYSSLGIVRAFLPRGTPVVAVSATLTARVRRDIMSKLHFPKGSGSSSFLNVGNHRNNVSLVVRACEHPLHSYADLDFIIPRHITDPSQIPKTYIYVDNINTGADIVSYLASWIGSHTSIDPSITSTLVCPFNATMSHKYCDTVIDAF